MFRPKASLGLVLLVLLSLAAWGCSKSPSQEDAGKTGGAEVKKTDDSDSPRSGRSGRAVGKVLRKMQADGEKGARDLPPGMRIREYPDKTVAAPWESGAKDYRREVVKTPQIIYKTAKTAYEAPDKTEYKPSLDF